VARAQSPFRGAGDAGQLSVPLALTGAALTGAALTGAALTGAA
jgi:hypothetical protein